MTEVSTNHDVGHRNGTAAPVSFGDLRIIGAPTDEDAQITRLQMEVNAARARLAAARARAESRDQEARDALRVELEAGRDALAQLERQHQEALAMIRESAATEVARILAEARGDDGS